MRLNARLSVLVISPSLTSHPVSYSRNEEQPNDVPRERPKKNTFLTGSSIRRTMTLMLRSRKRKKKRLRKYLRRQGKTKCSINRT